MSDDRLSQNEFQELFGDTIPIEAINFVFRDAPPAMTMPEVRAELRKIAARHKTSPNAGQIAAKLLDAIVDDPTHGLFLRMSLTPEDVKEAASILHQQDERIEALMRERTSLIDTKREQIDRLNRQCSETLLAATEADALTIGRLTARVKVLEEALTPSGDTKAAYSGEFHERIEIGNPMYEGNEDDEPETIIQSVPVSWTTIKEIMAAIRARATEQKS